MRYRITFAKTAAMRYTSHLDLHKAWERTIRRAALPLAYTQGFSPHPKINLASALPLGFTGDHEVIDIWLDGDLDPDAVEQALKAASPPGILVSSVARVDDRLPALQSQLLASDYTITFLSPIPNLDEKVQSLLSATNLPRERRGKPYDLRPLLLDLHPLPDDEQGCQRLAARLRAQEGATGRPEEIVAALGASPEQTRIHRTALVFSTPS